MTDAIRIYCIGDTMVELISEKTIESRYQRTLVLDPASGTFGGAVWNVLWYFAQLGRQSVVATHYGFADRERVIDSIVSIRSADFIAQKESQTDTLVVLPNISMPAIYLAGKIGTQDIGRMLSGLHDEGLIVFAGSRNAELRREFMKTMSTCRSAIFVFSPSYSLYDYSVDEVRQFMALSHLTFVNEHEAKHLERLLTKRIDDLMRITRLGAVVTRGARGATLFPRGATPVNIPSVSGRAEDVIGAGEAFLCGFMHAFLTDHSWRWSGETGAEVAAQVVRDGRIRAPIDCAQLPPAPSPIDSGLRK